MQYKITVDMIMFFGPCLRYNRARVEELWAGREWLTPLEISNLYLPVEDRLWALLRKRIIPECEQRLLTCKWARKDCVGVGWRWTDSRSLAAIDTAERYAIGEATNEELVVARVAATAATRIANRAVTWSAAKSAVRTTWDSAGAAAWSAVRAAKDVSRNAQLEDVKNVLRQLEAG